MIRIRVLGCYSVQAGDEPSDRAKTQPRRLAVLALIARAGERGITRDKILNLLWPDSDEESGRHALTQAVYALRKDLGANDVISGVQEIRFDPLVVSCDLHDFECALRAGQLEKAVECYGGPFLDGFRLPGASEFERWVDQQRLGLEQDYADALTRLARTASESGDATGAVAWWRKLAGLQPMNARFAVELMQALVMIGDRQGALRHARIYEMLIEQELDLPADQEVAELAERIRDGSFAPPPSPAPKPMVVAAELAAAPEPEAAVALAVEQTDASSGGVAEAAPEPAPAPPPPTPPPAIAPAPPAPAPVAVVPVPGLVGELVGTGAAAVAQPVPGNGGEPAAGTAPPVPVVHVPVAHGSGESAGLPPGFRMVERRQGERRRAVAAPRPALRSTALILAASFLVASTAIGVQWWGSTGAAQRPQAQAFAPGEPGRLIVGFSSADADAALAAVVAEAVRVDLAQSRHFQVLEPREVDAGFQRADLPAAIRLDSEAALKMARFEGVQLMVVGDVARAGPGYLFSARVISVPSGTVVTAARESARDSTGIIDAIDRLSGAIRERLTEATAAARPVTAGGK